ncbi:MAG: NAD(P)-dependent dehydrogenase (short-subunit alcohol dehydrogenase family) [Alphaproteobacteria bacterium]|jgi:NAD(P)-dependent dehydrogenase (short-subunit alcohol dehydrogenase family)
MMSEPLAPLPESTLDCALIIVAGHPLGSAVGEALAETGHRITLHAADDTGAAETLARALARQQPKSADGNIVILLAGVRGPMGPGHPMEAPPHEARAHETRAKEALKQSSFNALTRSLALELAPAIRVNAIHVKGTSVDARAIADTVIFILATQALTGQMIALSNEAPATATAQTQP